MVIDSHRHFWHYTNAEFGWIADDCLRRDFLPTDCGGMDSCVAVEARQCVEETEWLLDLAARFEKLEPFTAAAGEEMVKELSQGQGMGPWVHPIRVAVSGRGEGIGLFEMLQLLGRDRTVARLRRAADMLAN